MQKILIIGATSAIAESVARLYAARGAALYLVGRSAAKLDAIAALKPQTVIPGHSAPGAKQDVSQLTYTEAYLARFETELGRAPNAASLIEAMKAAYPQAGLGIALDIGAKVNKGEMKW